jgi:anti-sigma28 factor (negative regulator of flagellin synthesis)
MRLQLDTSSLGPARAGEAGQAAPASGSGSDTRRAGSDGAGAQDSIRISGASGALSRVFADRSARIQELSAAVQNGRYEVSSGALSRAIVEQALS